MAAGNDVTGKSIVDLAVGYQKSQILMTACSLGVFDILQSMTGAVTVERLAQRMRVDEDSLERVLNACAGLGLLDKALDDNGVASYHNSSASAKYLVDASAMSMKPVILQNREMYGLWARLENGVRLGNCQLAPAFGGAEELFAKGKGCYVNENNQQEFMKCMHMFSRMDAPCVVNSFDFSQFGRICDIGGGTGAMAMEFATWCARSHITILELPHVIGMTSRFLPKAQPKNLTLLEGDALIDPLPEADLYILSHVIHAWSDQKIDKILQKIFSSLRSGGAVLILEKILSDQKDGPISALMFDIGFMLMAEGRCRSAEEYIGLLEKHGFGDVTIKLLPDMCLRDSIMARKL